MNEMVIPTVTKALEVRLLRFLARSSSLLFDLRQASSLDLHLSSSIFVKLQSSASSIQMAEQDYDLSKDPKRKPTKSSDSGWKYGFWPDLNNKDMTQCSLCDKIMHAGVRRLKHHLAGGYADVEKCLHTTTEIMKEMRSAIDKGKRKTIVQLDDEDDDDDGSHEALSHGTSTAGSRIVDSSVSSSKKRMIMEDQLLPIMRAMIERQMKT
ncbi:hypothetical protein QQ045_029587 [Rhodiola kirilowii]